MSILFLNFSELLFKIKNPEEKSSGLTDAPARAVAVDGATAACGLLAFLAIRGEGEDAGALLVLRDRLAVHVEHCAVGGIALDLDAITEEGVEHHAGGVVSVGSHLCYFLSFGGLRALLTLSIIALVC